MHSFTDKTVWVPLFQCIHSELNYHAEISSKFRIDSYQKCGFWILKF